MIATARVCERGRAWSALPTEAGTAPVATADDRRAALALTFVDGIGPTRYRTWARADGGADRAFARRVASAERGEAVACAERALARAERARATLCLLGDPDYPAALLDLSDPPAALWCRGDRSLLSVAPAVAMVGTRDATSYGTRVTDGLARAAGGAGAVVVSGLARGIDAVAHAASLDVGGATVAVLGTGVDVPYPASHRRLYERIASEGLIVSEMAPGTRATPGAFPRRNRIVAALARATVVVEAGTRSGALITASLALELGRDVGAVPGPVDSAASAGANALLRDGAAVVTDADDLLGLLGVRRAVAEPAPDGRADPGREYAARSSAPRVPALSGDEACVWQQLTTRAADLDALAERAALDVRRCATAVGSLEATGLVLVGFDGSIARR